MLEVLDLVEEVAETVVAEDHLPTVQKHLQFRHRYHRHQQRLSNRSYRTLIVVSSYSHSRRSWPKQYAWLFRMLSVNCVGIVEVSCTYMADHLMI